MQNGQGRLVEIHDGRQGSTGLVRCAENLIPAAGQYLLASRSDGGDVLAQALFSAGRAANGFLTGSALAASWGPGTSLALRGPLGRGFSLPSRAQRLGMIAWKVSPACLLALLPQALEQGAELALACDDVPDDLPLEVEVQPLAVLEDLRDWADFLVADVSREGLPELRHRLGHGVEGQVLVRAPMPCGAVAECGVCAVHFGNHWKLACKDGPVFEL